MEEKATFAAGCFWGVEDTFMNTPGVIRTRAGYTGGTVDSPSYERVCAGGTGHREAVEVMYDSDVVSYDELLRVFWDMHDPTTPNRQGPDAGEQYRSVIFYHTEPQREAALASRRLLEESGMHDDPIVTDIVPASPFFAAEEYHQQYLRKQSTSSVA